MSQPGNRRGRGVRPDPDCPDESEPHDRSKGRRPDRSYGPELPRRSGAKPAAQARPVATSFDLGGLRARLDVAAAG